MIVKDLYQRWIVSYCSLRKHQQNETQYNLPLTNKKTPDPTKAKEYFELLLKNKGK